MEKYGMMSSIFTAVFFLIAVSLSVFFVQILWGWVVPDIFSKAVANGMLPSKISWFTALKLFIAFSIGNMMGGVIRVSSSKYK